MKTIHEAWREWHQDLSDDMVPVINPSFQRAWDARQEEVDSLKRRLEWSCIQANAFAEELRKTKIELHLEREARCNWRIKHDALARKAASK